MPVAGKGGLNLGYTDTGSGPPVVFIPGLVGSKEWFRFQSSGLSDRYRVVACDFPRARRMTRYVPEELAEELLSFLAGLRIYAAVIAGHCAGGLAATALAANHPDRCLALILLNTAPGYPGMSDQELLSAFAPAGVRLETWYGRLINRFRKSAPASDDDLDAGTYLARHTGGLDRATLRARLKMMRDAELSQTAGSIQIPTLIIAGSADHPHILAGSQKLHECIPDSTLEVLEDADHFCIYTRHDLVNSTIDDFLESRLPSL